MEHEEELIDAIKAGDGARLSQSLRAVDHIDELFKARITTLRPTNHAIGCGMTLLQFASFRSWGKGASPAVLLDHGATVDLHSACGLGMLDRITEILEVERQLLHSQVDGYFPMQFAIAAAQAESVKCLCDHGDDPNRDLRKVAYFGWEDDVLNDDFTPWKPIHMASLWGFDASRIPVVQALVAAGADLNCVSPLDGYRALHLVAMPNRVDMIRFLVSQGIDVDSRTVKSDSVDLSKDNDGPVAGFGCTPLMVAAAEGFPEATACLLELGADPTIVSDRMMTAMDFANVRFWKGQPYDQVVRLLERALGS